MFYDTAFRQIFIEQYEFVTKNYFWGDSLRFIAKILFYVCFDIVYKWRFRFQINTI